MQPTDLTSQTFAGYPPQAREAAVAKLDLLRRLPMPLVPILLREIIAYDWKFPSERRELDAHLAYLGSLTPTALHEITSGFAALALAADLNSSDWAADPEGYMERLTASLWSTHQMPEFRTTAERYTAHVRAATPA